MPNRLSQETSPYLLQHALNPVDWYAWGEEAFEAARTQDKPIFLSIGYSSCHWCHVMAHESFEDESIAEILNREFISIKVDREERPDVDDAYMLAAQLIYGRGGWPLSIFMTADKRPFFAGTYFPKEDRQGHVGFRSLCLGIAKQWSSRREEIERAGDEVAQAMRQAIKAESPAGDSATLRPELIENGLRTLATDFDVKFAGFGPAPKFPPHSAIEFLTTYMAVRTLDSEFGEVAMGMAANTLVQMILGGIHDHVGGGFHRYSTDGEWLLPHFEKMLYDNALMLANLARVASVIHPVDPDLAQFLQAACEGTANWMVNEMMAPEGYFYSALDADSEGEEGKYYVWTEDEIHEVLGTHAPEFIQAYGVTKEGNFADEATGKRTGANILHRREYSPKPFGIELEMLARARSGRIKPGLDDKALVGWNGLAIEGLVLAGYLHAAVRASLAILGAEREHGRLPRHISKGKPIGDAFLEDYAYLVSALLQVAAITMYAEQASKSLEDLPPSLFWVEEASRLAREMMDLFYDEEEGGFFATSARHEDLFGRNKPIVDQPMPSANAVAIGCLLQMGEEDRAAKSFARFVPWAEQAPLATMAYLTRLLGSGLIDLSTEPSPVAAESTPRAAIPEVTVKLAANEIKADSQGRGEGVILFSVPAGLHLNTSDPAARWLTATRVSVRPVKATVTYPPSVDEGYDGDFEIRFAMELPSGESGAEFEVEVEFQACTDTECLPPVKKTYNGVLYR
jgi:uncharacterized protein YyaL (SSP411 family)